MTDGSQTPILSPRETVRRPVRPNTPARQLLHKLRESYPSFDTDDILVALVLRKFARLDTRLDRLLRTAEQLPMTAANSTMHARLDESIARLLPVHFRVALQLNALAAGADRISGGGPEIVFDDAAAQRAIEVHAQRQAERKDDGV
jgi:hypothetical protein